MKEIPLTKNKVALVDDDVFDQLSQHKWRCIGIDFRYAARRIRRPRQPEQAIYMHREIMAAPAGLLVDHINGNSLDNRRCNLRLVTDAENNRNKRQRSDNTSGFTGVNFAKRERKWRVSITVNSRNIYIGFFENEVDAARAYNEAAVKHHGQFARLNVIP
jgi:hypothetical protein